MHCGGLHLPRGSVATQPTWPVHYAVEIRSSESSSLWGPGRRRISRRRFNSTITNCRSYLYELRTMRGPATYGIWTVFLGSSRCWAPMLFTSRFQYQWLLEDG